MAKITKTVAKGKPKVLKQAGTRGGPKGISNNMMAKGAKDAGVRGVGGGDAH